ncbi:hypothetical protein GCWU000321_01081 [Dialister invisus DSM 15470]|uniref:Uncharacterized protein n=2 Tax=Dialister invisus TaxID=218538 RepID=C9LNG0_9FIRM|nr:hypothetical protein GCWU000321_01081 [Dialister invisus DSM 15470]
MSPLPTSDWCLTIIAFPFLLRGIYGFACYFLSDIFSGLCHFVV